MIKVFYMLTKPGIIIGNIVTTAAGFALASRGEYDYALFLMTLLGLAFVIASAGAFNSYLDRSMDAKMDRTKNRPLVTGAISTSTALIFAAILGTIGILILAAFTNTLTVVVAATGFFVYLVLYAFWKYHSFYGTFVGSLAGAVPPVVGYCAVSNHFDFAALLLFVILILWQMPHFYAIAIFRLKDYTAASIPVLPAEKGIYVTKVHMMLYVLAFTGAAATLTIAGYTGYVYLMTACLLGLTWFALSMNGFKRSDDAVWARKMFAYSLVVIMTLCVTIAIDGI